MVSRKENSAYSRTYQITVGFRGRGVRKSGSWVRNNEEVVGGYVLWVPDRLDYLLRRLRLGVPEILNGLLMELKPGV